MSSKVTISVLALLVFTCLGWGADTSWTGVISDSHCGLQHDTASDQAAMCVAKCVKGGSKYVLVSDGKLYQLDPQDKINSNLAGRTAKITGTLSGDTITVSSATAVKQSKS